MGIHFKCQYSLQLEVSFLCKSSLYDTTLLIMHIEQEVLIGWFKILLLKKRR